MPFLRACPLTKDLCFFFLSSFHFVSFFGILKGKVGLNFLNVWLTWCVFNKCACQPYLPASLTVPFWRSCCTATLRLERLPQSLDLTITLCFSSLCVPWPWGALFILYFSTPTACFVKRKKLLKSLNLDRAVFEFPKGRRKWSAPVIRLSSLFKTLAMNYKYSVSLSLSFPGHGGSWALYAEVHTHTHTNYIPLGLFIYCTWQHFIHSLFAFPLFSLFYCPLSCHTLSLLLPPSCCDTNITGEKFLTGETFFHEVCTIHCHSYSYFSFFSRFSPLLIPLLVFACLCVLAFSLSVYASASCPSGSIYTLGLSLRLFLTW